MIRKSRQGTFDQPFISAAKWLISHGVRPNHITILQLPIFVLMIQAALDGRGWDFFWLNWGLVVLDGADGIVARVGGMDSRSGAIMDAAFDTVGIAIVLWGANTFHPEFTWAWIAMFAGNGLLYLQNIRLNEKVISYVRGPAVVAIAMPDVIWLTLAGSLGIVVWLLVSRMPAVMRQAPPTPG